METIKIFNYADKRFDTGIDIDSVCQIDVDIITGDEVLTVYFNDNKEPVKIDSADLAGCRRVWCFPDGHYTVGEGEFYRWNQRSGVEDRWHFNY